MQVVNKKQHVSGQLLILLFVPHEMEEGETPPATHVSILKTAIPFQLNVSFISSQCHFLVFKLDNITYSDDKNCFCNLKVCSLDRNKTLQMASSYVNVISAIFYQDISFNSHMCPLCQHSLIIDMKKIVLYHLINLQAIILAYFAFIELNCNYTYMDKNLFKNYLYSS